MDSIDLLSTDDVSMARAASNAKKNADTIIQNVERVKRAHREAAEEIKRSLAGTQSFATPIAPIAPSQVQSAYNRVPVDVAALRGSAFSPGAQSMRADGAYSGRMAVDVGAVRAAADRSFGFTGISPGGRMDPPKFSSNFADIFGKMGKDLKDANSGFGGLIGRIAITTAAIQSLGAAANVAKAAMGTIGGKESGDYAATAGAATVAFGEGSQAWANSFMSAGLGGMGDIAVRQRNLAAATRAIQSSKLAVPDAAKKAIQQSLMRAAEMNADVTGMFDGDGIPLASPEMVQLRERMFYGKQTGGGQFAVTGSREQYARAKFANTDAARWEQSQTVASNQMGLAYQKFQTPESVAARGIIEAKEMSPGTPENLLKMAGEVQILGTSIKPLTETYKAATIAGAEGVSDSKAWADASSNAYMKKLVENTTPVPKPTLVDPKAGR